MLKSICSSLILAIFCSTDWEREVVTEVGLTSSGYRGNECCVKGPMLPFQDWCHLYILCRLGVLVWCLNKIRLKDYTRLDYFFRFLDVFPNILWCLMHTHNAEVSTHFYIWKSKYLSCVIHQSGHQVCIISLSVFHYYYTVKQLKRRIIWKVYTEIDVNCDGLNNWKKFQKIC